MPFHSILAYPSFQPASEVNLFIESIRPRPPAIIFVGFIELKRPRTIIERRNRAVFQLTSPQHFTKHRKWKGKWCLRKENHAFSYNLNLHRHAEIDYPLSRIPAMEKEIVPFVFANLFWALCLVCFIHWKKWTAFCVRVLFNIVKPIEVIARVPVRLFRDLWRPVFSSDSSTVVVDTQAVERAYLSNSCFYRGYSK